MFTLYTSNHNGTCTTDGTMTAYCDNGCGRTSTIVEVDSKIHNYVYSVSVEPTCMKEGTGLYECSLCGDNYTSVVSVVPHDFRNYIYNDDATCTEDGTQTSYCYYGCGVSDTIIKSDTAIGHSFLSYSYNGDATCTEDGTKSAECERCDAIDTITAVGSVMGHSFGKYESNNDATCTEDGTESAKCIRCEAAETRVDENSALGHSFTAYTNDNNATCVENSTETALCDNGCGASDTHVVEDSALGHSFTSYVTIFELSCTVNGIKEAYCDNGCGEKDVITEEAKGHVYSDWIVIEEPDYYNEGFKIQHCTVCSEVLERESIAILVYMGFPDVWEDSWYAEGIEYCFKHGYILGTDSGIFIPNAELTREQFVVILARISGAKLSEYTESTFDDVNADSWYGASVIWANEEGLVNGIGKGIFGVGQPMTREQLAVILCRYAEKQGIDVSKRADTSYCDDRLEISTWALDSCAWAIKAKLLGSTSETANLLSPKMTVTRAQAARIFMKYDSIE